MLSVKLTWVVLSDAYKKIYKKKTKGKFVRKWEKRDVFFTIYLFITFSHLFSFLFHTEYF